MRFNKNFKYFLGAAAIMSLGMTSCSSEDGPDGVNNNSVAGQRYMAVTIKTIGDTKALPGNDDFEEGVGDENKIEASTIRFYFFTADGAPFLMQQANVNGTVTNTNMVQPLELVTENTDGTPGTEINGVLVLGTPDPEAGYQGEKPSKVIAVANPKTTTFESLSNISIRDFKQKVAILDSDSYDFSTFSMTSSSYFDQDGNEICYTDVTNNIMTSASAAKENPAYIYLERLAAKVRVSGLGTYTVKGRDESNNMIDAQFMIRGNDGAAVATTLQVELTGWQLINRAASTYALKNIAGLNNNAPFPDWNDYTRHRSYWANTSASNETNFLDRTFDLTSTDNFKLGNFNSQYPTKNVAYTYGNTSFQPTTSPVTDRGTLATGIVVKAVIKDGDGNPVNLVRWGAEYFTLNYFKKVVVNAWNTTPGNTQYTEDDVQLVKDSQKKNYYKVTVHGNEFSGRFTDIYWWKDGVTTYRANIVHYQEGSKILLGVVRNHIYDYKFTNVIGLGLPGEDPVNPPTLPESYLAAVVEVLNWHIVSNETVLE